ERSAMPTPSIATSTVPSGTKPVKLVTRLVTIRLRPSGSSRLITRIMPSTARPSVPAGRGSGTLTPIQPNTPDTSKMASASSANRVTGCGSRLPSHSTVFSRRVIQFDWAWSAGWSFWAINTSGEKSSAGVYCVAARHARSGANWATPRNVTGRWRNPWRDCLRHGWRGQAPWTGLRRVPPRVAPLARPCCQTNRTLPGELAFATSPVPDHHRHHQRHRRGHQQLEQQRRAKPEPAVVRDPGDAQSAHQDHVGRKQHVGQPVAELERQHRGLPADPHQVRE